MHTAVYGSGYLGTIISACLADFGLPVTCFDEDSARLKEVAQGKLGFYEKNLEEVLRRNMRAGRLMYSTEVAAATAKSSVPSRLKSPTVTE